MLILLSPLISGSQGIVYEGIWQGATVAVKWSIGDQMDVGACELLFSRLLSHPNVVQTYDAKVAVLDAEVRGAWFPGCAQPLAVQQGNLIMGCYSGQSRDILQSSGGPTAQPCGVARSLVALSLLQCGMST
jgi:hypothetical protein